MFPSIPQSWKRSSKFPSKGGCERSIVLPSNPSTLSNEENSLPIAPKVLSFKTKRNLVTNSSEFYNLSYEYINDCLRAGLVYRREFYKDSELEPEDSLMFKITLVPFGNLNSPSFD